MSIEDAPASLISSDLLGELVASISGLAAFLGLRDADAADLLREASSSISVECTRLCRFHGASCCVGPASVTRTTGDASALLIGWLVPALSAEGRSFGCALAVGSQKTHIALAGANPAMLFGVAVLPTYSFVVHGDSAEVIEAQAPVCVLPFSHLCRRAVSLAPLVQPLGAPAPTRVHACGKVVSVGAPFTLKRDGSPAMLIVLLLSARCTLCGECSSDSGGAQASVTLLVKGADLVPQWRELIEPGQDVRLVGLEKQRIPAAEGEGARNVTVLRVKQHPAAAVCFWAKGRSGPAASGAGVSLGTVACYPDAAGERPHPPGSIEKRQLDAWTGVCVTRLAGDRSSFFQVLVERLPGSCVSYSGVVTLMNGAAIVLDNDPRTTLWWVPTQGGLPRRPSLPAALRVGCRATVHNAHPLLVGRCLVGLGWCAATSVAIADVTGGWLGLGNCEIGGHVAARSDSPETAAASATALAPVARLSTHLTPTSVPAVVWLQAGLQRLMAAGLVLPLASLTQPALCLNDPSRGDETFLEAWGMLQTAARALLWPWQDTLVAAVPTGEDRLAPAPSGRALGPQSVELMCRSCEKAVFWSGEETVAEDERAIPTPSCAAFQGVPASRALLIYTPRLVAALGLCAAEALAGAFRQRTDSSVALFKDPRAVRSRGAAWAAAMCRTVLSNASVAGLLSDASRLCGGATVTAQVVPGADWASVRIRMTGGGCKSGIKSVLVAARSPSCATAFAYPTCSDACELSDAGTVLCLLTPSVRPASSSSPRASSDSLPEGSVRLATLSDFVLAVDVVRCQLRDIEVRPFESFSEALQPFLSGGLSAAESLIATEAAAAGPGASAGRGCSEQTSMQCWRIFSAPWHSRKRRRLSTPRKHRVASDDPRQTFAVRMYLQSANDIAMPPSGRRGPFTCASPAAGSQPPLICSVRASLTGLGDSLAVLVKKARVSLILVGAVELIADDSGPGQRGAQKPTAKSAASAAETSDLQPPEGAGCCTLKLRLRHVSLVPGAERRILGCSFGPETVDVYCPCSFANSAPSSMPLGFGPGAIVAIERVRPIVAPKTRNIYWVAQDSLVAKPVITVLSVVNSLGPALAASEVLRRIAASNFSAPRAVPPLATLGATTAAASAAAAPVDAPPALLQLDRLLWPLGGPGSSKLGTVAPSQRTCRSIALDPAFDRTHFVLRGQPRQVLWASVQWEDCSSGCALEPCGGHVRGSAATLARKRELQSGDPPAGLTVLGVPMQRRSPAGMAGGAPLGAACEPVFKLEAKVIVDDGTGEAVVQVIDAYLLPDLERCAAELERRAADLADRPAVRPEGAAFVPYLRLGVAASVLGTSAFWLCHWAAAAAFFGQIQVLPRLASAAGATAAPPQEPPQTAVASAGLPIVSRAAVDPATVRYAQLLAAEPTMPSGLFGHLIEDRASGLSSALPGRPLTAGRHTSATIAPADAAEPVGSKRKPKRRSMGASGAGPAASPPLNALLAARFTSRLPHVTIEAAAASLHTHLARSLCTSPVATLRDAPPGPATHAAAHGPAVALDFVCVRIFPVAYVPGGAATGGASETGAALDASELDRRSLATRKLADAPLRRLLGLSDGAPAPGGPPPAVSVSREFGSAASPPAKVTLRCLDVRPVGARAVLDAAVGRCNSLLAALPVDAPQPSPSTMLR